MCWFIVRTNFANTALIVALATYPLFILARSALGN